MRLSFSALDIAHGVIADHVKAGDICIDATAGRGRDTVFLCGLVGESGRVTAFDVQREAVEDTKKLVKENGFSDIARVVLDGHEHMDAYEEPETVSCVVFNFGWLPGGDHNMFTRPRTSIEAIKKAMALLKPGGIVAMCIYYGKETGFEEKDALLEYLATIDSARYSVVVGSFVNRTNCPPITAFILKDK